MARAWHPQLCSVRLPSVAARRPRVGAARPSVADPAAHHDPSKVIGTAGISWSTGYWLRPPEGDRPWIARGASQSHDVCRQAKTGGTHTSHHTTAHHVDTCDC